VSVSFIKRLRAALGLRKTPSPIPVRHVRPVDFGSDPVHLVDLESGFALCGERMWVYGPASHAKVIEDSGVVEQEQNRFCRVCYADFFNATMGMEWYNR
jgi:hypothetical protein